ncbi:MAG: glycosyltransferase family 39 protein [Desulfoferrobacter sp.]
MKNRCYAYLFILLLATSVLSYYKLGEPTLENDEALYARIVDNIHSSKDWFSLKCYGSYYTHKPPLYFWLTAATYNLFNDEETRIRFWSAGFGIGCALLTFVLGCMMFSPEAGLFAGFILSMNRSFLFLHGARHGGMDSGVIFCTLLALLVFWNLPKLQRPLLAWIAIGVCIGIMCMLKPLIGILLFIPLTIHWEIYYKSESWKSRLWGPAIALFISILFFAPWHLYAWKTFGSNYMESAFGINVVKRVTVGLDAEHMHGPFYYWKNITKSSLPFSLFIPALAGSILLSRIGSQKRSFGLVSIVTLFWIGAFSLSVSKLPWYMYPVFPLISLSIAALLILIQQQLRVRLRKPVSESRLPPWVIVIGCCIALGNLIYLASSKIPRFVTRQQYLPLALYQYAGPEKIPSSHFVLLNYPGKHRNHTITYYSDRFTNAVRLRSVMQLNDLLEQEGPVVIVIPKDTPEKQIEDIEKRLHSSEVLRFEGYWGVAFARGIRDYIPEWLHKKARVITMPRQNSLGPQSYSSVIMDLSFPVHENQFWNDPGFSKIAHLH